MPTERTIRYLTTEEFEKLQKEAETFAQELIEKARLAYHLPPDKNLSLEQILEVARGEPFNIKPTKSISVEDKLADIIFPTRNQPAETETKPPITMPRRTSLLPRATLPPEIKIR